MPFTRPEASRPASVLVTLIAVAVGGCSLPMSRAHLLPIARTNTVAPYVQVREIGSGPSRRWFWSGESWHAGITLDLLNRGALPTTIELARARLIVRSFDGSETASVRPLEGGPGGLPARVDGDKKVIESLCRAPVDARMSGVEIS
jgi:hypothetical protein